MIFRQITSKQYICGESPLWDAQSQTLCFTDIDGKSLHRIAPESGRLTSAAMPGRVGCIAPTANQGFIAAMEHDILELDRNYDIIRRLHKVENASDDWRFNDGKCDRTGRFFWVGSIYLPRDKRAAGVWRLAPDGQFDLVIDNITTANGIAWSPDGRTMYLADSRHSVIWAYNYDLESGGVSNRRVFYKTTAEQGRPDGAVVDELGYYWFASFGGSRIIRLTPKGELDREIMVPAQLPTMVCFGGENMGTMFLTSHSGAAVLPTAQISPADGAVFAADAGVVGLAETPFQRT